MQVTRSTSVRATGECALSAVGRGRPACRVQSKAHAVTAQSSRYLLKRGLNSREKSHLHTPGARPGASLASVNSAPQHPCAAGALRRRTDCCHLLFTSLFCLHLGRLQAGSRGCCARDAAHGLLLPRVTLPGHGWWCVCVKRLLLGSPAPSSAAGCVAPRGVC